MNYSDKTDVRKIANNIREQKKDVISNLRDKKKKSYIKYICFKNSLIILITLFMLIIMNDIFSFFLNNEQKSNFSINFLYTKELLFDFIIVNTFFLLFFNFNLNKLKEMLSNNIEIVEYINLLNITEEFLGKEHVCYQYMNKRQLSDKEGITNIEIDALKLILIEDIK